ncbi:Localization factor PodJL [compost metagenome]
MFFSGEGVPQDYQQSVFWFQKAAEQGNAIAQHRLGLAYRFGVGVAEDPQQAIYWIRKASEQGHTEAQEQLQKFAGEAQ